MIEFNRFREFDGMREQHSKLLQQLDQMRKELTDFTTEHCRQEVITNTTNIKCNKLQHRLSKHSTI